MYKKKRVLLIINSGLLNSGVPKVVTNIVSGLHSTINFDIAVQSRHKEYYDDFLEKNGCKIFYMGKIPNGRWKYFYHFTIWPIKLYLLLITRKYNCIHSFTAYQSGIDCFVAKLCGIKIRISNTHGVVSYNRTALNGSYQKFCKFLIKKFCTKRIGVSKHAAESIYHEMKYDIIYNCVPFHSLNKISKKKHENLNFIQIGYFNDNKNQLFSLEIINKLISKHIKCHLFLIGFSNEEKYYEKMLEYIKEHSLYEHVTILPQNYKKEDLYPIVDFMLLPSIREGLSFVALECQSANIKCLVSDNVPEEANMGLLHRISLNSIDTWIHTIGVLMNTQEKVLQNKVLLFSEETFIKKIQQLYN